MMDAEVKLADDAHFYMCWPDPARTQSETCVSGVPH